MEDSYENSDDASGATMLPTPSEDCQPGPSPTTASGQSKKTQSSIGACDACRLRKVRCLANESSMSAKCQRCTRANRECVYTTHSKTRRRKRTDTRVKELEEKVRGLSMLLENKTSGSNHSSAERDVVESTELEEQDEAQLSGEYSAVEGYGDMTAEGFSPLGPPVSQPPGHDPPAAVQSHGRSGDSSHGQGRGFSEPSPIFPDVVDRGVLSMEKATELYQRYVDDLLPLYPAVVFEPDCTATRLRENKPILFLAVLAASAGTSNPALNLRLNKEIQQAYATKVSIQGRKSMEIVQAMLVSILWTYPPDRFEDLKFHQQITQAATMALDLGLAQRPRASTSHSRSLSGFDSQHPSPPEQDSTPRAVMTPEKRLPDSAALDSRRTLLACYVFCASVTMSLRLPNMLRFSSWMAEAIDVLETSPHAAPTDKRFIAWVKMQRIVEECGTALALDDLSETNVSLADERVQAVLRGCEKQLDAWRRSANATKGVMNAFLEITYHANNIYLHEIALHPDHDVEDFRPPFFIAVKIPSTQSQTALTPPYINAIIQCISSADALLTTFLDMNVAEILQCPTLVYVRVVYASVILIKLSISVSMPSSELGKIIDPRSNKVETYLDQLLIHLREASKFKDGSRHVISWKFLGILTKLKMWCQHQKTQSAVVDRLEKGKVKEEGGNTKVSPAQLDEQRIHATGSNYERAMGTMSWSPPQQNIQPSLRYEPSRFEPPPADRGFFTDFGKRPAVTLPNRHNTQSMQSTWPNNFQTTTAYSGPATVPFNFTMDSDPNLFTHLVNTELDQNDQDNWMPDADLFGLEYANLPEFNWATWPQQ